MKSIHDLTPLGIIVQLREGDTTGDLIRFNELCSLRVVRPHSLDHVAEHQGIPGYPLNWVHEKLPETDPVLNVSI